MSRTDSAISAGRMVAADALLRGVLDEEDDEEEDQGEDDEKGEEDDEGEGYSE